jgi:hypothetical protein
MHEVDGDECLLASRPTLAEALTVAHEEIQRDGRASLSIWASTRGILALPGRDGNWLATRAATPQEAAELRRNSIWRKITRGERLTPDEQTEWSNLWCADSPRART